MQINEKLYKQTKTKKIQLWFVSVEGNEITVTQGQVDGKLQEYKTYCEGKNIGRSNETSPEQQAILEATSKWEKQVKKGYTTDPSGEISIKLPMKISVYQGSEHKVPFPCYVSPKLNGVNGEYWREGSELKLYSRGGEEYPLIKQQVSEILSIMDKFNLTSLNGEIYKHGEWLQDITGAVKKWRPLTDQLKFYIFDIPCLGGLSYYDRTSVLQEIYEFLENEDLSFVRVVNEIRVSNHDRIEKYHKKCVNEGYEGVVIRDPNSLYEYNKRSTDVWKYKVPKDGEYLIKSYKIDKNNQPVFICVTEEGKEFNVKPKGDKERREEIRQDVDNWVGNWLKIEYEELSKTGVPLKPVGIDLRDKVNGVFV